MSENRNIFTGNPINLFIAAKDYGGINIRRLHIFILYLIKSIIVLPFACVEYIYYRPKIIKTKIGEEIPSWIYVIAIIISSLLFAAGHLPSTSILIGLSLPIVLRAFILNGIVGVLFGYLYWKKGLAYAINAHIFTHVFNQLIFAPLLFG